MWRRTLASQSQSATSAERVASDNCGKEPWRESSSMLSTTTSTPVHRLVLEWPRGSSSGIDDIQGVELVVTGQAHQYSGSENCIECAESLSKQDSGPNHFSDVGQLFCGGARQQTGMGGTISRSLCQLVQEIFLWVKTHFTKLLVRYIPGKQNMVAHQLSCHK